MLIPNKFNGYHNGTRQLHISMGGGGGGPTQTTSTVQNTNIPAYAQQYVENMLGTTQEQLFQGTRGPDVTNPETGEVTKGIFEIEGFKPYQAYGGTYDQNKTLADGTPNPNYGKELSYDATKGIAGFTPDQLATQKSIMGLQTPAGFNTAGLGTESVYNDLKTNQYTAPTNLGYTASNATSQGYTSSDAAAIKAEAARLGVPPEAIAAQFRGPRDVSSGAPLTAFQMRAMQSNYAPALSQYGMTAAPNVATKSFTDRGTAESYMSPYMQQVVERQQQEAQRESDIAGQAQQAQAARSGAFGGSRDSIMRAEAARNLATQKGNIQAQGLQNAFQQAQQQFNTEQGIGLQGQVANQQAGLTVGQQNLGAALGVQQLGAQTGTQMALANLSNAQQAAVQNLASRLQAQGMTSAQALQAALANQGMEFNTAAQNAQLAQQTALSNQAMKGQYGLTQGQFEQQANMQTAAQAQQAALANAAARSAAAQFGAGASNQAALANAAAANQAAQFGAGQNLASAQTAAQYGLAGNALQLQAAGQLGTLSGQELAAQQGILGMQGTVGAQQQALDQAAKNQAIQDYANAQQYPLMQLGTMSNMLRGLPMQASTTNQYAASPNPLSQAVGTIGAGASIYNAMKPPGQGAAGGLPSEFKYAKGGITSIPRYDMGGEVEDQLENMDEKGLAAQAKESSSPSIRRMAQRILRERQMGNKPQGTGPMGVQYQAAQPQMPSYKPGGIVAFQAGGGAKPYYGPSSEDDSGEERAKIGMEERLAMPPSTTPPPGGIMGATAQPATPVPVVPAGPSPDVVKEAMRQRDLASAQANRPTSELLKEIQAERDALGVGENVGRQEFRAQQMAERANLADEKERQRHMRLAEFFASWGSTPGPVLVAGMNALKQSIPGIISDEKEAKKARKEADKIIYDIDEATRLEKLGMIDKATVKKEQAAKHAEDYNKYLLTFQSQRESDKRALEQTTMTTEAQRYVADSQAKSQSGYNAQRAKEAEYRNIEVSLNAALRQKADIEKDIEATRSRPPKGSPLAKAMDTANLYNSLLSKNNGDASKLDAITRKNGEQALETINKFETNAARRLREAENRVQTFENLFDTAGRGSKSGAKTSGSKDDPFEIMDILKSESPASAASANAPANAPAKTSTSRTGDASSVNPYVDTKGKARPDAPRGEPSKASKLVDEAVPVVKDVANKVANELSGSELRYLKDKIARNEKLSVTDRIRAERAGLL